MADPIRTAAGDRVRYAERDTIGVEGSGLARGINAELQFVRDMHVVQTLEHDEMGVHDTPQIARGILFLWWDGVQYEVGANSYLRGSSGASVASASRVAAGVVEVTLAAPMNTMTYGVADNTMLPDGSPDHIVARLAFIASTTVFQVARWSMAGVSPGRVDGDFSFRIFDGD